METKLNERTEETEQVIVPEITNVPVPLASNDVIPLKVEAALAKYSEEDQKKIRELADSIDVTQIEKVMNYGATPLKMTFEQCGRFLKDERGSHADQEVIARVIELSKKASDSNEEFNLILQEPGFFQKMFMKISNSAKETRTQKLQHSAVTSYKLLSELMDSYKTWLDMLKKAMGTIEESALSDMTACQLLEKFIIAGELAEERINQEVAAAEAEYKKTGLQQYDYAHKQFKQGRDIFLVTMNNLKQSKEMYKLSLAQLSLIKDSNINVQVSIHTQSNNNMALIGQQLRNGVLNAKNREVLEGQKAISKLSDELIKDISKTVGITAEQSRDLIYAGIYNIEAAKEAVQAVINSCNAIQDVAAHKIPEMKTNMEEIEALMQQLTPYVGVSTETLKIEGKATPPTGGNELKF